MTMESLSRRLFLKKGSGTLAGTALLKAGLPAFAAAAQSACSAREAGAAFEHLSAAEAREFSAIAARILPTTATPGATEAGAIYFFDTAFGTFLADERPKLTEQLRQFLQSLGSHHPGVEWFSDLDTAAQDAYLTRVESTPFFETCRFLTIAGVLGMASYGGNRDGIGWRLVGMDGPPHGWTQPYGYYDAEYVREHGNGE
jgi:gluconate 2-dehydrogenase gamma chain